MKVGVVTTSYPRFVDDPAGNFVGEHVAALRNLGHDVQVIAAADTATDAANGGATERSRALDHERVVRIPSGGLFYTGGAPDLLERAPSYAAAAAKFSARLAAAIALRSWRWDTIVAHWLAPSALACSLAARRTPILAIAHGGDVHTLQRLGLLAPSLDRLRARGVQLVFVSEQLRSIALDAAPHLASWLGEARVQPMGIDLARFAAIPRRPTPLPTIVIAARLVPIKGVDVAIEALAHLRTRVRLAIAGDGPERPALRRAAAQHAPVFDLAEIAERVAKSPQRGSLGDEEPESDHARIASILEGYDPRRHGATIAVVTKGLDLDACSQVEMFGALDTRARDRLLSRASVVVVPSRTIAGRDEGTPLIALEALAAGIPVIASDVGGLRSLRGVVRAPPDHPAALADAIDRVLAAPPSPATLRESVAHLDWHRVIRTLVRSG